MKAKNDFTVTQPALIFICALLIIGIAAVIATIEIVTSETIPYGMIIAFALVFVLPCSTAMIWQKQFKITVNNDMISVRKWLVKQFSFDVSQIVQIDWRTVETRFGTNDIIKITTADNQVTIESVMAGSEDMVAYILEHVDVSIIKHTHEDPFKIKKIKIEYDLRGSLIEAADYFADRKRVELRIKLWNKRQIDYKASDPEVLDVCMIFDWVEKYELSLGDHVFCGNEILHVTEEDDNTIEIIFLTDVDPEAITIKAQEISFRTNDEMGLDHFVP